MAEGVLGGRWGQSSRTTKIKMCGVHALKLGLRQAAVERSSEFILYQNGE